MQPTSSQYRKGLTSKTGDTCLITQVFTAHHPIIPFKYEEYDRKVEFRSQLHKSMTAPTIHNHQTKDWERKTNEVFCFPKKNTASRQNLSFFNFPDK